MRTAATTLRYKLLLLLLGLVLFVLCKPADGRNQPTGTAATVAADPGAKTAETAKVKKAKKHKKTRRSKARAAQRGTAKKRAASVGTVQINAPAVSVSKRAGGKDAQAQANATANVTANATGNTAANAMDNATGKDRQDGMWATGRASPWRKNPARSSRAS